MKKTSFLLVFLLLAALSSFSQSRSIFFEGNAPSADQRAFFLDNFRTEAGSAGYTAVNNRSEAGYTLRFEVNPNVIEYEDGTVEPAPPDEPQFLIVITFLRNADNTELVSFGFPFTSLDEMYDYTQFLFLKAAVNIPPPILPRNFSSFEELNEYVESGGGGPSRPDAAPDEGSEWVQVNNEWLNKWIYLRMSFGMPITYYELDDERLIGGVGMATDPPNDYTKPLDNKVIFGPSLTLGIEFHFLYFMSIEANFQANWEHLNDKDLVNMAFGFELKLPLKFIKNIVLEPYGAFNYPINFFSLPIPDYAVPEDIFTSFPKFGVGFGLEVSVPAGKNGAFFLDINYINYSFMADYAGDTEMKNPYVELYEEWPEIKYKRYVIGLAIGYKVGMFNRKTKTGK